MNVQLSQQPKTNGTRRHSPAIQAAEALSGKGGIELHAIGDSASIQRALSVVINAVAAGTLDPVRAKVLLYGLQIASTNARRMAASPDTEKGVPAVEASGLAHTLTAPATGYVELNPSQTGSIEREQIEMKIENTNAVEDDNELSEASPDTPIPPAAHAGQMRTPPSCFSPASGYSGGVRDRLLAIRQRSESRSVV
jgi:hypothetical protein